MPHDKPSREFFSLRFVTFWKPRNWPKWRLEGANHLSHSVTKLHCYDFEERANSHRYIENDVSMTMAVQDSLHIALGNPLQSHHTRIKSQQTDSFSRLLWNWTQERRNLEILHVVHLWFRASKADKFPQAVLQSKNKNQKLQIFNIR